MNVTRHSDANFEAQLIRAAGGSSLFDPVIDERTRTIVESVRAKGDAALVELTERFDGAKLTAAGLAVMYRTCLMHPCFLSGVTGRGEPREGPPPTGRVGGPPGESARGPSAIRR